MKNIRVLVDTNVILDWVMIREPNATNAKAIMEQCLFGHVQGYITSHSLTDIFYILRKDFSVSRYPPKDKPKSRGSAVVEVCFCHDFSTYMT